MSLLTEVQKCKPNLSTYSKIKPKCLHKMLIGQKHFRCFLMLLEVEKINYSTKLESININTYFEF